MSKDLKELFESPGVLFIPRRNCRIAMNERIGPNPAVTSTPGRVLRATVRRVGFWSSVLLPISYLPVMYLLSGSEMLGALAVLLAVNVVCLLCGRHYALER